MSSDQKFNKIEVVSLLFKMIRFPKVITYTLRPNLFTNIVLQIAKQGLGTL